MPLFHRKNVVVSPQERCHFTTRTASLHRKNSITSPQECRRNTEKRHARKRQKNVLVSCNDKKKKKTNKKKKYLTLCRFMQPTFHFAARKTSKYRKMLCKKTLKKCISVSCNDNKKKRKKTYKKNLSL